MKIKNNKTNIIPGTTQKPSNTAGLILLIALQLFIVFISNSKLAGEDDLFWYLSAGRYIVETGSVPSADVFGFTTSGTDWIPVEWGWDVMIYYIHSAAGYMGLHILSTFLILLIVNLVIYNLVKLKTNYTLLSTLIILLLTGMALRLTVKPHLITYLCITLLVTIIIRYRYINRDNYRILYIIPLIFILWINMHMGVLAGLFLMSLYFMSELAGTVFAGRIKEQAVRPLSKNELIRLGIIIFLSAAAALINPHGIKTFQYAFNVVSLKQLDGIYEWMSPFSSNYLFTTSNLIYYIFIAGLLPAAYYAYKKKDITPVILSAGFFIYSISAMRLMSDFLLVSVIFIAISVNFMLKAGENDKYSLEKYSRMDHLNKYVMSGLIILLVVMIPGNYLYRITGHQRSFGYGIDGNNFPVKMFDFMKKNNIAEIGERPFNSYETGGFFAWNFPGKKGFIGSRTFSDEVWNSYTSVLNIQPGFENTVKETGFDYFMWMVPFLNYSQNPALLDNGLLSYLFRNNNEWKLVFWNDNSFLFVRNEPKFHELLKDQEYKYLTPFNLYFNREYINKGVLEEKNIIESEITRRSNEDPDGRFTKSISNYLKTLPNK